MMKKSITCSESSENAWIGPEFDYHGEHSVVLSSKDNQGKEGVGDQASVGTNNESSTDTDIMDSKVFQTRSNFLGVVDSSPSAKDVMVEQIPIEYHQLVSPSREVGRRKREFELPDMNEMPPCSGPENAMENMSFNTSKTESLDMVHLHSQVVNVEKLTSNPLKKKPRGLDPNKKWVKCIKNSRPKDASCTENINTPLSKYIDNNRTIIESTSSKHLGEKHMELSKNMMLSRSTESSSMLTENEQRYLTLSHSWIRRWCHNVADTPTIKPPGDPQRSNTTLDALEGRQLRPSIATMALLGKAMSSFKTCEFKNKGSFVVWNS